MLQVGSQDVQPGSLPRVVSSEMILQVGPQDVQPGPFPHIISSEILPPALYSRLRAEYPSGSIFETSLDDTGGKGSRSGVGTGFDIYRGDAAYDVLIKQSSAWAELDAFINSQAFVDQFLHVFGDTLEAAGCSADIRNSHYSADYVEPRSMLTEKMTMGDRIADVRHKLLGEKRKRSVGLFSRLDIQKAIGGYKKPPHCDRPNRLCSLIIYFTDAEAAGIEGGNLLIYKHRTDKPVQKYERHPAEADVNVVAELTPRENLGV